MLAVDRAHRETREVRESPKRASSAPRFELRDVSRAWGDRVAIADITITIHPGECVVLGGPSGSGKSTLLSLLSGAVRPTRGNVLIDGKDLATLAPRQLRRHRARCASIMPSVTLVPQLNVHQNVIAGCLPHWPWYRTLWSSMWPVEQRRIRSVLEALEIGDRQWDFITQLSTGQQQRVAIARGLVSGSPVLLADEPTSALDPATARRVARTIFDQARRSNATLIFCTHWLQLGLDWADRLIGLRGGRILLDQRADTIDRNALDHLYEGSDERI
jgi:phosphonate transport system ATP-binding protein